jgi:putative acetyltransferase
MKIERVGEKDYVELLAVWEASVRATHDFLREEDIESLKPLILNEYFRGVRLRCVRSRAGGIMGFSGVAEGKLEMLFIGPENRGRGIGAALCRHAVRELGVEAVDVNEQNPQAVGFYEHMGFKVVGRSALDGQGNPFPLLHMELA